MYLKCKIMHYYTLTNYMFVKHYASLYFCKLNYTIHDNFKPVLLYVFVLCLHIILFVLKKFKKLKYFVFCFFSGLIIYGYTFVDD